MKATATTGKKQVRFSSRSIVCVFNEPSLSKEQASKLWYSKEETDLFKAWQSHRVQDIRSQLKHFASLGEEDVIINATAILGLEKYLSPELTAAYKDRRLALQRAVLAEHRGHRVMRIPHATARLALVSATHSKWARERARAAALFLEQDVLQDSREMNLQLQAKVPRRCSMSRAKEADATEEVHKLRRNFASWSSFRKNTL